MTLEQIKITQEDLNNDLSSTLVQLRQLINHIVGVENAVEENETLKYLEPNGQIEEITSLQRTTNSRLYDLNTLCRRLSDKVYNKEALANINVEYCVK